MKDAIWDVDPVSGFGFRDPRRQDRGQQALGLEWRPDLAPLRRILLDWLAGGPQRVETLRRRTFLETVYRAPHASQALRALRDDGLLRASPGRLTDTTVVERV